MPMSSLDEPVNPARRKEVRSGTAAKCLRSARSCVNVHRGPNHYINI